MARIFHCSTVALRVVMPSKNAPLPLAIRKTFLQPFSWSISLSLKTSCFCFAKDLAMMTLMVSGIGPGTPYAEASLFNQEGSSSSTSNSSNWTAGGREHGVPGQHHSGHCAHEAGHPQGDHARQHLQTDAHQVGISPTYNSYYYLYHDARSEVGGWPPLVISFQHYYDKEAILNRADMLERSGILVRHFPYQILTNPRTPLDHGGHVAHGAGAVGGAAQVHEQSQGQVPDLPVFPQAGETVCWQQVASLAQLTDRTWGKKNIYFLRMFVWNLEEGRVTEQMVVTIPATPGNIFPGLNVQSKYGGCQRLSLGIIVFCLQVSHQAQAGGHTTWLWSKQVEYCIL